MSTHIKKLIAEGEHEQLDFKFEISDARKLARSLVAFANSKGGKLLIGVKDNGHIAGIRSEEELFMLEAAANMYCKPTLDISGTQWEEEGKTILEVDVPANIMFQTYYAPDLSHKWKAYIRVGDQNLLANRILMKVWEKRRKHSNTLIKYTAHEKFLLNYLKDHPSITFSKYCKLAKLNRYKAERILINLVYLDIIEIHFTPTTIYYRLSPNK